MNGEILIAVISIFAFFQGILFVLGKLDRKEIVQILNHVAEILDNLNGKEDKMKTKGGE